MRSIHRLGRLAVAAGVVMALAVPLVAADAAQAATGESLSVNLAATRGPATAVGEGFLYGISQDGTQPADQFMQPLRLNAFRGGGWFSGGWIKDQYQYGAATQADIASILAQARRLESAPYHNVQYQLLMSDLYGANAGQPSNTVYPCTNGDCSNWISFIDATVGALQASGLTFAYDIWNEPELSIFWKPGVNTTQYFQMWDSAYGRSGASHRTRSSSDRTSPSPRCHARRSGRPGWPTSRQPARCRTGSPTMTKGTWMILSRSRRPSTAH